MKTDYPSSREKKSPPELFTHDLTLTHMKKTKKKSYFARLIGLLVRYAFVALMGAAVFSAGDTVHAVNFVSNFDQPYQWVDKERTGGILGGTEITTTRPYRIWVDGGLAQEFRTGLNQHGYDLSYYAIASTAPAPSHISTSFWSSSNGVPRSRIEHPLILEPNTNYFIAFESTSEVEVEITSSSDEDSDTLPGWSIGNNLLKRNGDIWEVVEPDDVGRAIFPADGTPVLRILLWGAVLDSRSIIFSLTQVSEGQFKATATASAPSDIVLPITIINGVGATTVTIPAGSTESDVISVSRTPGTTFPVTVNIGNLPSPPAGYALFKTPSRLPLQVLAGLSGDITPVSARTPQVRDAIVAAVPGVNSANDVTEAHLAGITGLGVNHPSGTALPSRPIEFQIGDFSGLTALATLEMNGHGGVSLPDGIFEGLNALERVSLYGSGLTSIPNSVLGLTSLKSLNIGYHGITSIPAGTFDQLTQLNTLILDAAAYANTFTSLPDGVFDKLTSLTRLNLDQNNITSLPDGVFDQLTSLESLNLDRIHSLSSLPADVFDQLTSLTSLSLQGLKPTSLPDGIFSELSSLTFLDLSYGRLTNLPAGIFSGLSSLTSLRLGRNSVDPLLLTVSLEKIGDGQFKAAAPTGAPFDIVLPLNVRNGSISGGANTLTIPKGGVDSASLTVTRTPGTTATVTVDIGTLPGLPTDVNSLGGRLHQGYTLVKSDDLPLVVINRLESGITPVSECTPQVREAILGVVRLDYPSVSSYVDITETHLAGITALYLNGRNITALKVGDFDGLTNLEELRLYNNQLTTLPEDIFDGLTALTTLRLYGNQLSTLPDDIFDELIALTTLQLGLNQFTTLPGSIFDGLTKLTDLRMIGNQFTTLPEGIFDGLTALTVLYLGDNAVNPLSLTVSLEKVEEDGFKATAPTGAPFDIVLPLSIANGTTDSGAMTITIPAGGLESEPLTVLRTSDRASTVTVDIGTLPGLPPNHSGYSLAKSNDLPLSFTELGPVFTPLSERTPQVRDQIVLLTRAKFQFQGVNSVNDVTPAHLRSITTSLDLRNKSITSLKAGDFSGLSLLETLHLHQNSIASLPENVFDGLSNLTSLDLRNNSLTSLPANVFDGLSNLTSLSLNNNSLTSLPADVFDGLSNLTSLELDNNSLTSLPANVFDGLSNLTSLELDNNSLTSLPTDVFDGLSNLTTLSLYLDHNSRLLQMTVSLEKVGEGVFKAVVPTGAPFEMVLPLTITNGSINSGATTITIPAGSVESASLTVSRTTGTTAAVTVNIGTLPRLPRRPSDHSGYYFVKPATLPLVFMELGGAEFTPVSERTPQVRDAIVAAVPGINSAAEVTIAHLMAITHLKSLKNQSITSLKEGDFDGLTSLTILDLRENDLTTLPAGVFKDLISLTSLGLQDNDLKTLPTGTFDGLTLLTFLGLSNNVLTTLPADIFKDLTSLQRLYLFHNNTLTTLPAGIFDGLTSLEWLSLQHNALTTLPAGIFNGLTAVRSIDMIHNELTSLPDGLFEGLTALKLFRLGSSAVAPLPLTVSLEKVGTDQIKAVAPTGAPFDIVLPISVTNGSISGSATSITIPTGSVESETLTVTRTPDTTAAVTVDIGTLPGLASNHYGYTLAKSTDLPLEVISATAPQVTGINIPDANLRAKIESALGKTSGDPITAAEMATLTSLTAQDARIANLTGLETATNLTTLKLGNNTISDISALAGLTNLTELQLWDNSISNISAVAELTNLTHLYLRGNAISDISAVARLTNLTHLRLGENSISNISALAGLTNLTFLSVKENSISDISAVAGLTNLTELVIGNNAITNISAVAKLTNLVWLDAPNNSISDISAVANLTNLTSLMLTGNTISDISTLTGLTKLIELYLGENSILDLSPLAANTGLGANTEIDVQGNPLSYPSISTHIPALQARDVYIDFNNRTPAAPVKISGDSQQSTPSTALANPFVVEVRDGNSATFARVPVTFAVTAGGGMLSVTNTMTDANGRAQSTLILGSSAGTNTVRVSVQGVSQAATFTAEAITTNTAPVFTDGTSTTRAIAENTAAGINIGDTIAATDADNDTLTYTLGGTDDASFAIDSTTGQLKTQAALDYETKSSYSVTVSVSDDNGGSDSITVTINVTDINEQQTQQTDVTTYEVDDEIPLPSGFNTPRLTMGPGRSLTADNGTYTCASEDNCIIQNGQVTQGTIEVTTVAANTAPMFTDGTSTTRAIAENTAAGVSIGTAITATDTNNDILTYTLSGTDVASFSINSSTGQLQTKSALDYETKRSYTVTITVSDGSLTDTITVTINITDVAETPVVPTLNLLSDRTPEVRDAIVAVVPGVNSANDVTEAHLKTITRLDLNDKSITSLKAGDFDGLSALQAINLTDNQLSTLPVDVFSGLSSLVGLALDNNQLTSLPENLFSGLSSLRNLYLNQNQLTALPENLFSGLSSLEQINLHTNRLTTLPANVFSGLSSLTQIYLRNNRLTSLPADVFSGLSSLQYLYLDGNHLMSLPSDLFSELSSLTQLLLNNNQMSTLSVGMFRGLTASTQLWLQGNTVDPLSLTISLEKVGVNQFKVSVPAGAPFTIVLPLRVVNGTISGGVSTLTIPQGSVESGRLTVTRTSGTTAAVTVDIGTLPGLPANHRGYQLVKSTDLPLEIISSTGNRAPIFTEGANTTRTVAENTATGVNIGAVIAATDPDNDTLTYTLNGTDAASFSINSSTGQLQTKSALDYETKATYTVTVTVSDGSLADTIVVTINVTDADELPTDTGVCKVGDILAPGESCTYPDTDATFSVLDNGHARWNIPGLPSWLAWANQVSIGGSLSFTATINDDNYHFVAEEGTNDSWEIKEIGDDRTQQPETPEQPQQPGETGGTPTLTASTTTPLTEATLDESIVTLTLSGGTYESSSSRIRNAVTVSTGITGVTVRSFDIDRVSDTEVTVKLTFDGTNFDTNSTITFTVGAGAIAEYDGTALTSQVAVTASTESVVASTASPLTEDTLDGSVVTLTLSGRTYESSGVRIRNAVTASGISGVTVGTFDIDRVSDTQVTVELTFNGDINTDSTLTFTAGADAIAGYDGAALTAQVAVSASTEAPEDTDVTTPVTEVAPPGVCQVGDILAPSESCTYPGTDTEFSVLNDGRGQFGIFTSGNNLNINNTVINGESYTLVAKKLTSGSWEIEEIGNSSGQQPDTPEQPEQSGNVGGTPTLSASTAAPLTEATLHEGIITLNLSDGTFERSSFSIRDAITLSGISGVTVDTFGVDRVSDTQVTVELAFDGNMTTDSNLTLSLGADAIKDYDGAALTSQISVTAVTESVTASTDAPLTEATLDESVVTLTLSGRKFEQSISDIRPAASVSGISGVTFPWHDPDKKSDTEITMKLEFDGDITTDSTLTFTVGADAIAGYNGPALTAQVSVSATTETPEDTGGQTPDPPQQPGETGGTPTLSTSTTSPLTETTLDESVVTLTLSGRTYEQSNARIRTAVTISGIAGVTARGTDIDRVSDTQVTVELTFDRNINTDGTLTFTVGAGAIADYTGSALTAQIPVTALSESVVATTAAPLTEATLDESVVTLTLNSRSYESSRFRIRDAVTVSGISGVTVGTFDIDRVSDTQVTVELTFNGNISTDSTLIFTVGPGAIAGYDGAALTAQVSVSASTEAPVVTDGQTPVTPQQPVTPEQPPQPENTGGTPTLSVTTAAPLTKATLHEGVVTLRLSGGTYERFSFSIRNAVTVSGIAGVTVGTFGVDRVSDTEVTIELEFDGNINANATLTFTVGSAAIVDYDGAALTAQIPVTANTESIVATTVSPLTEATLDESVITLALNGTNYERSIFDIRDAVTVSAGITGVTVGTFGVRRVSDTEVTVELEFDGTDFDTTSTLTFTVGAEAIAGYNGPALTTQISVTAVAESVVASTATPLTEDTLDGSVVTLTLSGRTYERSTFRIRDAVTVSGISGVTVGTFDIDRVSDTEVTVELTFSGDFDTNSTLTFTVGAGAIAGYNGPALTAQVPVTATVQVLRAPSGISLMHVPLQVTAVDGVAQTIESVGDLYNALGGVNTVNLLITYDPATQGWRSYLGESSRGTFADTVLTDNQGIIADMKAPVSLHLDGDALGSNGSSSITLHPGTNLVGIPLRDSRITRVSDLLALDGIGGNVPAVTILNDGTFQTVEQAGDAGDIPITGGQSFILNAWEETTVAISGQGWDNVLGIAAAAPMKLTGIEVGDTTPILALTGSIVSPVGGWGRIPHLRLGSDFRVIVKNLSTGSAVATVIGDTGDSYQLTVVDTETGQAARIGDILEISVKSPNPLISVQPLRYTITAEDVKRSRIQLS